MLTENPKVETTSELFPIPSYTYTEERCTRISSGKPWSDPTVFKTGSFLGAPSSRTYTKTRELWLDPEWQSKIRNSKFASFPYYNGGTRLITGSLSTGLSDWVEPNNTSRYRLIIHGGPAAQGSEYLPPSALGLGNQKDLLVTEAIANAKSGALQALVSLMEGPKTLTMLTGAVANLAHLLKVARKRLLGDRRELMRLLDRVEVHGVHDAVGWWLQYRYGWRILLLEVKAAMDLLMSEADNLADVLRRSRATDDKGGDLLSSYISTTQAGTGGPGGLPLYLSVRVETRAQRYRGSALVFYALDELAARDRNLSLQFAPTVWELLPGSFVAEWFVNIGDWLRAFATQVPGLQWHGGQYSELLTVERRLVPTRLRYGSTKYTDLPMGEIVAGGVENFKFRRSLFDPATTILPPVTYNGLNLLRAMDATALFTQRFSGLTNDVALWRFKLPRK